MNPITAIVMGLLRALFISPLGIPFRMVYYVYTLFTSKFRPTRSSRHTAVAVGKTGVLAEDSLLLAIMDRSARGPPVTREEYTMYVALLRKCTIGLSDQDTVWDHGTNSNTTTTTTTTLSGRRATLTNGRGMESSSRRGPNSRPSVGDQGSASESEGSEWHDVDDDLHALSRHTDERSVSSTRRGKDKGNADIKGLGVKLGRGSRGPRRIPHPSSPTPSTSSTHSSPLKATETSTHETTTASQAETVKLTLELESLKVSHGDQGKKLTQKTNELRRLKSFAAKLYLISVGVFFAIGIHLVRLMSANQGAIIVDFMTHTAATAGYVILLMASMAFRKDSPTNLLVMSIILAFSGMICGYLLQVSVLQPATPLVHHVKRDL